VSLRTDLERLETEKGVNEKFVEWTRKLDQILNSQRSLQNKTGLGYSRSQESSMRKMNFKPVGFEEPHSYAKVCQEKINEDKNVASKRETRHWNKNSNFSKESYERRMNQSARQQRYLHEKTHEISNFGYSNLFYGHCYKCHIFLHKAIDFERVKVERDENL